MQAHTGAPVDAAAYNRLMQQQGFAHYCGQGACDRPPVFIEGPAPAYPPGLQSQGIEGHVILNFTIDENGRVVAPDVASASRPEFAEAAVSAVGAWRFQPARLQGMPVRIRVQQQFPFELIEQAR